MNAPHTDTMRQLLIDATAMLYWNQKKPLTASSWAEWVLAAHTVLKETSTT
jgi:hypothetical protein